MSDDLNSDTGATALVEDRLRRTFDTTADLLRPPTPDPARLGRLAARRRRRNNLVIGGAAIGAAAMVLGAVAVIPRLSDSHRPMPPAAGVLPAHGNFSGILSFAPDDVWAASSVGDPHSMLEHWDGSSWTTLAPPPHLAHSVLSNLMGTSDDDLWVTGYGLPTYGLTVAHWNGIAWTEMKAPYPPANRGLSGAHWWSGTAIAPDDLWLVGDVPRFPADMSPRLAAAHWDGSSWRTFPMPDPAQSKTMLSRVDGTSDDNAWAVGYTEYKHTTPMPYAAHWNGSAWHRVRVPGVGVLISVVAVSSSEAWAIGDNPQQRAFLEHFVDGSWHAATLPGDTGHVSPFDMSANGPADIWIVGGRDTPLPGAPTEAGSSTNVSYHWDGSRWTEVATPRTPTGPGRWFANLAEVSVQGPDATWAIGGVEHGTHLTPVRLLWTGERWVSR